MTWLLTRSGAEYHLNRAAHPDTMPSIDEIAWALAHINRYTGHASRAYSVAEHSLLVADYAHAMGLGTTIELLCLMHDAHECITGDVSSPVKEMVGPAWFLFEDHHQRALLQAYDLWDAYQKYKAGIKFCDLVALATERRDLTAFDATVNTPWPTLDAPRGTVKPWHKADLTEPTRLMRTPRQWAAAFTERFTQLANTMANTAQASTATPADHPAP